MQKITLFFYILMALLIQQNQVFAQNKITFKKPAEDLSAEPVKIEAISPKQLAASGFADIVEDLLPAVVNISAIQEIGNSDQNLLADIPKATILDEFHNKLENQFKNQKKKNSSIGSGFIISKDGFIVTNSHVIEESSEIIVNLNDGAKYKAKAVGIDKKTDLALLKINADKDLKFVKFGDSTKARIGDWIIVVGNPYGLGGSVSVGIVSARSRDINNGQVDDFIQTDAAINKGNSGGPLFNSRGEVIGISTAIFSPSGGNVGIGFATPSATAAQIVKQLKEQGEVTRGWLGVSVQDISEEIAQSMQMEGVKGVFVIEVTKDGPADKAGILPSDVITKFDDQEITEMKILPKIVAKTAVGKISNVTILRRGKLKVIKVRITKMRDVDLKKVGVKLLEKKQTTKASSQILGLGLAELSAKIKTTKSDSSLNGLLVVDINPKSEAAEKGIILGDIILSANQVPLSSAEDLNKVIEEAKKSTKKLFLFLQRSDANYAIVLSAS